jgi:hypothetical protein
VSQGAEKCLISDPANYEISTNTHSFITLGCSSPSPPIIIIPFNFTFPVNLKYYQ